ncbi:MAG: hypothetical protein EZS28_047681, partial [Streblomastix strix]
WDETAQDWIVNSAYVTGPPFASPSTVSDYNGKTQQFFLASAKDSDSVSDVALPHIEITSSYTTLANLHYTEQYTFDTGPKFAPSYIRRTIAYITFDSACTTFEFDNVTLLGLDMEGASVITTLNANSNLVVTFKNCEFGNIKLMSMLDNSQGSPYTWYYSALLDLIDGTQLNFLDSQVHDIQTWDYSVIAISSQYSTVTISRSLFQFVTLKRASYETD